ncbi:MAG: fumarate/nitrate reduction transcriptional regulator Fnr [Betaproteobacteria bacterium]|nr:fumarate/nitrate reduction transcriptional regulator Fnr [Betaproteobacteria bacterium]MDH5221841.1 fumarate/nitrate reduction transcriptional regulator Fnr [Betaproteobacteria bacterium]MDH5350116.1 fumarate/nitrate reduction transcriptional regulator Fnr [Betaproteobacteria bacterium]
MSASIHLQPSGAPRKFEVTCSSCSLRELCLPGELCAEDLARVENLVYARRRVKRGDALFTAGGEFGAVYSVRSGFFKTSVLDNDGREQVTGFFMGGELLGLEGISGRYHASATALEDSEVCVLPYALIEQLSREVPALQRQLHAVLAREIARDHGVMLLLGSMRAEERLATFLLNLSRRFVRRGYSPTEFQLRMTREEIGSYLGLKLETVSRLFSAFQKDGLIEVQQKHVHIRDIGGLERVLAARH